MKKLILISTYLALSLAVHAEKKYITDGFGIWSTENFKKFTPKLKCTNPILGAGSIKIIQTVDIYDRFILYEKNERFGEYQFEFCNAPTKIFDFRGQMHFNRLIK